MERYLKKDFDVQSKHSSEAALRRWRSAVTIVKNRRRRFRDVANLHMRSEAEKKKLKIQETTLKAETRLPWALCLRCGR
ncbi:putative calcium-transporting ATPase 9, plasma membrane-type [Vitis vinifera]|uniref:Putative calcium-transporting ATPase 9, plasma membrane-type n=1 Tax=Vitis vinifera TaxID=29760 RepID=A0A438JKM9_VITVI|nr:putative calcium-transporting ATPase 9, plasma membrane-type [Vitis vinifera]